MRIREREFRKCKFQRLDFVETFLTRKVESKKSKAALNTDTVLGGIIPLEWFASL